VVTYRGIIVHSEEGAYLVVPEPGDGLVSAERVGLPAEDSFGNVTATVENLAWVTYEVDDDGTALIEATEGDAVTIVNLRFSNKGGTPALEIDEDREDRTPVDINTLLGDHAAEAQRIASDQRAMLLRFGARLTWQNPAYLQLVTEERKQRDADTEKRERRARLRDLVGKATSPDHFVYPFNFVPFPSDDSCIRSLPQGHDRLAVGNYSGTLTLRLTAESPLLLRSFQRADDAWAAIRRGRRAVIPGSTLKGAIRSLHETLAGGCLRVINANHVPAYREQAATKPAPWTLGVVREVDELTRPTAVHACDLVVWARADVVQAGLGSIATGDTCDVAAESWSDADGRLRLIEPGTVTPGSSWVILLSPAGARSRHDPYYVALGRLTDRSYEVTEAAYEEYRKAAENAEDVVASHRNESPKLTVNFNGRDIGTRQPVGKTLPVGTVLWVKPDSTAIHAVSRSVIWRSPGSGPARDRIPRGYLPCSHSDELCPTCQIFGSADDTTARDQHEYRSSHNYRSHIRIGDAVSTTDITDLEPVELAAASAPRPGSGQLYLHSPGARRTPNNRDTPTYQWGAAADRPRPRRLRGRKYYWPAHSPNGRVQRHLRYPGQTAKMTTKAELVPTGTAFDVSIHFENLTPTQLGGLLAACTPDACLGPEREKIAGYQAATGADRRQLTLRIGGGKPWGLGIMAPAIITLDVHTSRSRYRKTADDPGFSLDESDRARLITDFRKATHDDVVETWTSLAALLDPGFVNPERVAYPPADDWETMENSDHPNPWGPNLDFFKRTSGTHPYDFVPLPDATDSDQYLPRIPPRPEDGQRP